MRCRTRFAALIVAVFSFAAATVPTANAAPPEDACSLLTRDQVSAALGVAVGAGSYVTPGYLKTCTWASPESPTENVKYEYVTLALETAASFEGGKKLMGQRAVAITSVSGIGDDAYYLGVGNNIGLIVKKGNVAFKVAMYGDISVEKKKAIEKTLALQVLSRIS
jgi:hypothetical protein